MTGIARPSCYSPEPPRCGVCDRRCRSNAEAFQCERGHDREDSYAKKKNAAMRCAAHPLPKGFYTVLDDEDVHLLSLGSWHAVRAAQKDERFYVAANIGGTTVYLHRLILRPSATITVDHRNGDGLDNRRSNLRLATRSQNNANKQSKSASGFRGVFKQRNRYRAVISTPPDQRSGGGRLINLGSFVTAEEAARARDVAALERWGEFARLNFPINGDPPAQSLQGSKR